MLNWPQVDRPSPKEALYEVKGIRVAREGSIPKGRFFVKFFWNFF